MDIAEDIYLTTLSLEEYIPKVIKLITKGFKRISAVYEIIRNLYR